ASRRRDGLPPGRLPRRRPLLRPQRLPDHVALAGRVGGAEPDQPAPVLVAPREAALAGPRRRRARLADPVGDLRARRPRENSWRRSQLAPLLPELAPDPREPFLLRADGQPFAAAAPLVARGGGAVLLDLAAPARPRARARRPEAAAYAHHRRDRRLGDPH